MSLQDVRPITYLKHATADLVRDVAERGQTVTITQHGEAKVVIMGVQEYERWRSAVALLKLVNLSASEARKSGVIAHDEVMAQLDSIVDGPADDAAAVSDAI